jgi:guanylate kinase
MKLIKSSTHEKIPTVSIFIMPPSRQALKRRLRKRKTETDAEINKRLKVAEEEMEARTLYDHIIVNRRVDQAVREIEGVLK